MKRFIIIFISLLFTLSIQTFAQSVDFNDVPMEKLIQITKAEDELRYDETLQNFIKDKNPAIRKRAILAAGRIGDADAVPLISSVLEKDFDDVRQMAAFALGEIESIEATPAIIKILVNFKTGAKVRSRAIEAAGKIAAANEKDNRSKSLAKAISSNLEFETENGSAISEDVVLLGITAALRAKTEGIEMTLAKFLNHSNWRIRADALNTLARLRAANVNEKAGDLLVKDENPIVRANAVRVLGTAKHDALLELITDKALNDKDLRVRINAIRALSQLTENDKTTEKLLTRAEILFAEYKKSDYKNPSEENELLTIASALGTILKGSNNERAIKFLEEFRKIKQHTAPEVEVALVRISPKEYAKTELWDDIAWQGKSGFVQGLSEAADLEANNDDVKNLQETAKIVLGKYVKNASLSNAEVDKSFPAILSTYAKYKPADLAKVLQDSLKHDDVIIRATAARLLGDVAAENPEQAVTIYRDLSNAFSKSQKDKLNDASLAILDALKKQYEKRPKSTTVKVPYMTPFIAAMESPDYLVRINAANIYKGFNIPKPDPMTVGDPSFAPYEAPDKIERINFQTKSENGIKSRIVLADYKKALSRKNGEVYAILETDKGKFTINFFPEEAPLTVDNFINLANSGYFNGLEIHRVVPNFVMQDGDPRGDGSGGPGWQIRDEINQIQYERGMVGMALSGENTGGSQWFITHSPQPHLDGGYTIFGKVNETDMKIVDNLVRGDKILKVSITTTKSRSQ